jgi:hypothetical protein
LCKTERKKWHRKQRKKLKEILKGERAQIVLSGKNISAKNFFEFHKSVMRFEESRN